MKKSQKSEITVKEAALKAYENLPKGNFFLLFLLWEVKRIIGRPNIFDDTIGIKLRELRKEGKINYKCIKRGLSSYEKL